MRFVAGRGAWEETLAGCTVVESHREGVAGRGAVVAKLLRPGDATEQGAVAELLLAWGRH